jgi:hypothetical protein
VVPTSRGGPQLCLPTARRRTPHGGAVRFEEEDVSVLGGDLRLASFEAGEAVAVWWWRGGQYGGCGGQHGDARSVCLSLCLSLTCSLSFSRSGEGAAEGHGGGVRQRPRMSGGVCGGCGCRREWLRRATVVRRWPQCASGGVRGGVGWKWRSGSVNGGGDVVAVVPEVRPRWAGEGVGPRCAFCFF